MAGGRARGPRAPLGRPWSRLPAPAWGLALALALLVSGCASSRAPWHVPAGSEERFLEASRVCRMLTDERGELAQAPFEACMERRGWKRQNLLRRLFRS